EIDCPSTPAAPWFAFTRLKASQTSRLGILNGFASSTGSSRHQMASVDQWPWLAQKIGAKFFPHVLLFQYRTERMPKCMRPQSLLRDPRRDQNWFEYFVIAVAERRF